ncbi:MAG: hypothetical protein HRT64_13290 [Erythrobacter sp.]|nr:hypothetical protein [Erythrobacter sp.]
MVNISLALVTLISSTAALVQPVPSEEPKIAAPGCDYGAPHPAMPLSN